MAEFTQFGWKKVPDPYDVKTFEASRLTPTEDHSEHQQQMAAWVNQLISRRKQHPSLGPGVKGHQLKVWTYKKPNVLTIYRKHPDTPAMLLILGFNNKATTLPLHKPQGTWRLLLDNHSDIFSLGSNASGPTAIDLRLAKPTLSLPEYPAWLYQQSVEL